MARRGYAHPKAAKLEVAKRQEVQVSQPGQGGPQVQGGKARHPADLARFAEGRRSDPIRALLARCL
jgi:oligoribonuclease NrnB/cAMP/cGMP phosphodiesterase (DHH superfamily)